MTAEIVNKTDDNGVMFIVCSYNDAGDVLTDAAVEIIPKSDISKRVSIDLKKGRKYKNIFNGPAKWFRRINRGIQDPAIMELCVLCGQAEKISIIMMLKLTILKK